ncbi:G-alpha-domain-containing protein [Punctularia strigosozonata HHB-11173 SS5]|uniref:G-alpha-domain-containing protein n=1 Tax=Punctularia strigosozonata (strain HHB-11173) TaxID=741275 RepID=R7S5I6_PUNST|nr:G-alpha-domain-containing protein [Punctularia strigosozonata HHB-11173 SS5]EIN05274.1 G-alpha-domain-containing protein [Punctularia strigosozonata HHB-11173 SS5]
MGRSFEEPDPLSAALRPPPDETPAERARREQEEAEAKRVSDEIDAEIDREKTALKKKRKPVKVLLLGQSESGKSTTLKNFQLTYAAKAWAEERNSWRDVIRLNLVRTVNNLLDLMSQEMSGAPPQPTRFDDDAASVYSLEGSPLPWTEKHRLLKLRLGPLRSVQRELETRLGAASQDLDDNAPYSNQVLAFDPNADTVAPLTPRVYNAKSPGEFFIRSNNGWKTALDKLLPAGMKGRESPTSQNDEFADVIAGCATDIAAVWHDEVVRDMLKRRKIRLEDQPGFFLEDVHRIAVRGYTPTDSDVVRARLRTVGVQEHRFVFEQGRASGTEWILYDVGGHRSSRAAWYPYFDDVDAIIFLAPISPFDEKLAEDRRVNRLEDSFLLWRQISSSKLLAKTQIILFLNKCDLLERKLKAGVRVKDHVPSFGDRPNDVTTVAKYFQHHFKEIAKASNPISRPFYVHLTSVIDTKGTAATLAVVEEGILRDHLQKANLL